MKLLVGSLLVASQVHGCALKQTPSADEAARAALPDGTEIAGEWTTPEWDSGAVDDGWISTIRDEELAALVAEAVANNLNLQVAAARIERAEGIVELAETGLKPVVGAGAEISRIAGPEPLAGIVPVEGTRHSGGLNIAWEADVWGRIRAGIPRPMQLTSSAGLASSWEVFPGSPHWSGPSLVRHRTPHPPRAAARKTR